MKRFCIIILLFLCSYPLFSQPETIDLHGVFRGKYRMDDYHNLSWRPSTTYFTFVDRKSTDTLFCQNARTQEKTVLLTVSALNDKFPEQKMRSIPAHEWIDQNSLYIPSFDAILHFQDKEFTVETLPIAGKKFIDYNAKHKLFLAKEGQNILVMSEKNSYQPILICSDTGRLITFGETVFRSEWGIHEGQYISPSANYIAFYRKDETTEEEYPLVNTSTPIATAEMMKYPMAGRQHHTVTVGIFDVAQSAAQNKSVFHYLKTDIQDGIFLTNVTFSPDEKRIYISHLNRAQNHLKLVEYDVATGAKIRTVLEEKDNRYVEPQTRIYFLKNNRFIWQSDCDGWKHCYLYDFSGNMIKQLTRGDWDVIDLIGVDAKEENLYFITNKDNPTGRFLYQLTMKSGKITNLTPENGTHAPSFSSDYQFFIDRFSNIETPLRITLQATKGKTSTLLINSKNPYQGLDLGKTEIFSLKNKNGDDLYCRMIYPPAFDAAKKYPCLIYVYGGPHSQLVTNNFMSGGVFLQYLAQKGYVIFTLDNRGTANRGVEFEKSIHRQLGVLEVEDQMVGVDYLKSKPFIDASKIGLDGWSYGGFMTLSLITAYPDVFRAASCGGPVVDWKWYEVMYGERYMDTPEENPEGYNRAAIIPKVKDIKSHLLVMHGAQDHTVVLQHSLELLEQAVKDNIQIEYFVYPSHDHNVRGIERVHLWNKIEKFHNIYLKGVIE